MTKGQVMRTVIRQLVVLAGVLCGGLFFSGTIYASSPSLLITEVQPQSAVSKTEEFIEIYNPTGQSINLNTLQVMYFSSANSSGSPMVLTPSLSGTSLKSGGYLLLKQSGYALVADAVFGTSGLSDAGGHVQLLLDGQIIDTLGWGTATHPEAEVAAVVPKEKSLTRKQLSAGVFQDTDNNKNDFLATDPSPSGGGVVEDPPDVCSNIEGLQLTPPAGYELVDGSSCQPVRVCRLEVSEISAQPNFNGQEYIEFYNSTASVAAAQLCSLSINGGSQRTLPEQDVLPGTYLVMGFASGVVRNATGSVSLTQSDGSAAVYEYPETYSGQVANFQPSSLVGVVSDQPTPGAENQTILFEDAESNEVSVAPEALSECPAGKYRNPATNRCKNIETALATLAPCDEDEERNPETNRCRKILTASSTLATCAANQERNPATNRCRKVTATSSELKPCAADQERNPETNRCRKALTAAITSNQVSESQKEVVVKRYKFSLIAVLVVLLALLGYGIYEYRVDLQNFLARIREAKARGRPPG